MQAVLCSRLHHYKDDYDEKNNKKILSNSISYYHYVGCDHTGFCRNDLYG